MKIKRDSSIEAWLFDEIRRNWGTNIREGIHLSDLLSPKRAYWQRKQPMLLTNDEILYFTMGRSHEDAFLRFSNYEHGENQQWKGIWYTPDMFFNFPVESKTRRAGLADPGKEAEKYEHYVKQIRGYCAITNKKQGWLLVWVIAEQQADHTTKPILACYQIEFTERELETERKYLLKTKNILLDSLERNDPSDLPNCAEWMCGKRSKEMIKKPHCITCNREFETAWGINKHLDSKTGKGHKTEAPVFRDKFISRCKWYESCDPFGKRKK